MSLPGSIIDEQTIHGGLVEMIPDIHVEVVKDASSQDIHKTMTRSNESAPASCWYFFQGHGYPYMYLASDSPYENRTYEGLSADKICHTLGLMDSSVWRVFATDFCHSGNYLRLRYMLHIDGTSAKWVETPEWVAHKDKCAVYAIAHGAPTLHFAGSTHEEEVYEGRSSGGFFTKALVGTWGQSLTLPNLLRASRNSVNDSLDIAKESPGFDKDARQTPQVYSSIDLNLEDTQVLAKIQRGER